MKSRHSLAAAALASVLMLTSCGGKGFMDINDAESISFSWWGKDIRHSYTISALREFEKQNEDIDVITKYSEYESFQKKMDIDFYSHNECDVMQINYDWLYSYSPDGTEFYDLSKLSDQIDFSNFTDEQLSYGRIYGKINGISNALNTETCYYNKDIYDRYNLTLPSDWEDLFKAAKVMNPDGVYPVEMSKKASWLMSVAYEEQRSGRTCYDGSDKVGFTKEDFADLLRFYKRLVEEKVTKYYKDINKYDFINGVSAGNICWVSDAGYYCEPLIQKGMNIVVGEYLRIPGSKLSGWYAKPTSLYCIKRDTKNPEAAAKLVNFLVNSQEMAKQQGLEKGIPLSRSMLEVLEANDQLKGIQFEADKRMSSSDSIGKMSQYVENAELLGTFEEAAESILFENGDIEENAARLYDAAVSRLK